MVAKALTDEALLTEFKDLFRQALLQEEIKALTHEALLLTEFKDLFRQALLQEEMKAPTHEALLTKEI